MSSSKHAMKASQLMSDCLSWEMSDKILACAARDVSEASPFVEGMGSERSEPLRAREESQPAGLE